jgi:hypothetical protein
MSLKSFKKEENLPKIMDKRIIKVKETVKINGQKVKAKMDTGAYTASIDKSLAKELNLGPVIKKKKVKSAHGEDIREVIEIKLKIKNKIISTTATLTNRKSLKYPLIVGRKALSRSFVIDPRIK